MSELPPGLIVRRSRESDYAAIVAAIPEWWETPNRDHLGSLLPRLFLQFFTGSSRVIETESGELAAFLIGFRSQDDPRVAYIHFVGVNPSLRRSGVASWLYRDFFAQAVAMGCTEVRAITGPANARSRRFHAAMGFAASGDREIDGVLAYADYDGVGEPRVTFSRPLP